MPRRRQRIWITRAQPAADVTAERVRALGHEAMVAPLLAVRPVEPEPIDLEGVAALAFTSANGVRAFAERRGIKLGGVAQPLRAALTGRTTSPPIFDVLAVLGKSESLSRLQDQVSAGPRS